LVPECQSRQAHHKTLSALHKTQNNMKTYKITHKSWFNKAVKEFVDAPTTRQAIDELGQGVVEIINYLQKEGELGDPKAGWSEFINDRISDIDGELEGMDAPQYVQEASGQMKKFWKGVDKVLELYCCQLLMTDEDVEEEVEGPEIMEAFSGSHHRCYHSAMIEILEILYKWMEVYLKDGTYLVIHRGGTN